MELKLNSENEKHSAFLYSYIAFVLEKYSVTEGLPGWSDGLSCICGYALTICYLGKREQQIHIYDDPKRFVSFQLNMERDSFLIVTANYKGMGITEKDLSPKKFQLDLFFGVVLMEFRIFFRSSSLLDSLHSLFILYKLTRIRLMRISCVCWGVVFSLKRVIFNNYSYDSISSFSHFRMAFKLHTYRQHTTAQ